MGEVYRARDRKLDREVAIKVLPEQFSRDKERVARFEREAKLLASLNHPNIASIYGFEQSEGMHYLVLELVEGETLAERIARGSIPVEELLDIAIQIADALEEAHEKGVIRRDLKPANIKLTPDGKVKVLDFGLAKAFAEETLDADSSMSPTLTRDATRVGVILGTAAYMSPEQARGKSVDKRSDIFAFGSVLYEMLTGKKAFPGEGVSDVLASVIKLEPDWSEVALAETSHRLRELLHRCLEKNPKKRRRDIGDVRNELVELTSEAGALGSDTEVVSRSSAWWTFGAVFAAGALVAGLVATFVGTPASSPSAVRRLTLQLPRAQRLAIRRNVGGFAVSPDGGSVIYSAGLASGESRLYLRSMDSFEATAIDGTEQARNPFFSPDGEWVGFAAGGKLRKVRIAGGSGVLAICDVGVIFRARWERDGTILFFQFSSVDGGGSGIYRVSASGGTPQRLDIIGLSGALPLLGDVLPGGSEALVVATSANASEGIDIDTLNVGVVSFESGKWKPLFEGGHFPRYVATGHIVYETRNGLMAAPFDPDRLEMAGPAVPVLMGLKPWRLGDLSRYAVSRDGSLVYVPAIDPTSGGVPLFWVDRSGSAAPATDERGDFASPRLSPDGRRLAIARVGDIGRDIWILDLHRDSMTRLTYSEGVDNNRPLWSPDGNGIFFTSNRTDPRLYDVFSKPADGSGEAAQLTQGAYRIPTSISADGRTLLLRQRGGSGDWDIGTLSLDGLDATSAPEILVGTRFNEDSATFSPNDRWLAYVSDESGCDEVYVRSFPDLTERFRISKSGGVEPVWSHDGSELFYRNGFEMLSVSVSADGESPFGTAVSLFVQGYALSSTNVPHANYDVAADGRFIMVGPGESNRLHVVLNWTKELKRLVPTDN